MAAGTATRGRGGTLLRLGATAVAAVVVAEVAAWLLSPDEVLEPLAVDAGDYFPGEQVDRATDYRSGQRLLMLGGLAAQGALLVALIAGRPSPAHRLLERAGRRPVLGGAAAAAGLYASLQLVALPFDVAAHERAVDVGLSTQDLAAWGLDWVKANLIGIALAALAGTAALALMRRFGRSWWIPGSAAFVGLAVVFVWLAPVALAPLFSDFDRLEPGAARSDALELARRAGVEVGEVYRVDASRRSTSLNAYVDGIGPTKRVVLYDNLLEAANRSERRSVIAHELGHVEARDLLRGLTFLAISTPLALLFTGLFAEALARRRGDQPGRPAFLPAFALALTVTSFAIGVVGNQLSRRVEARADTIALQLTDDPRGLIDLQLRLARSNLSDPDPPGVFRFLYGTHPTTLERIGAARAWERGERP